MGIIIIVTQIVHCTQTFGFVLIIVFKNTFNKKKKKKWKGSRNKWVTSSWRWMELLFPWVSLKKQLASFEFYWQHLYLLSINYQSMIVINSTPMTFPWCSNYSKNVQSGGDLENNEQMADIIAKSINSGKSLYVPDEPFQNMSSRFYIKKPYFFSVTLFLCRIYLFITVYLVSSSFVSKLPLFYLCF